MFKKLFDWYHTWYACHYEMEFVIQKKIYSNLFKEHEDQKNQLDNTLEALTKMTEYADKLEKNYEELNRINVSYYTSCNKYRSEIDRLEYTITNLKGYASKLEEENKDLREKHYSLFNDYKVLRDKTLIKERKSIVRKGKKNIKKLFDKHSKSTILKVREVKTKGKDKGKKVERTRKTR